MHVLYLLYFRQYVFFSSSFFPFCFYYMKQCTQTHHRTNTNTGTGLPDLFKEVHLLFLLFFHSHYEFIIASQERFNGEVLRV